MASSRQRLINASSFLSNQKEQIGGLNVKRSTVSGDAFKKGTSQDSLGKVGGKESSVGKLSRILRDTRGKTLVNEKKITLLKKVGNLRKDNQKEKVNSPLLESLQAIAATTDSIRDSLIQQQDNDKSTAEQMRREKEEKERKDQEKGLEAPKPLQKIADKVIAPVMSLWDRILKFVTTIFLGKILMNFLDWFGNPENQGKIQTLVRFVKDWWPALVGAVVLFGTGFGGLVTGLTVAIATFIPKMLAAITALKASKLAGLGGKGGLLKGALLVGGGVLAGMGIGKMMDKGEGEDVSNEKVQGLNKGGQVRGSGNTDTVPAMLTPGEFVMSKGAVQQYGVDTMESMNAAAGGTNRPTMGRYKGGGFANVTNTETTPGSNPFSFGVNYVSPEEAKEKLAARGMPSMELMDGTVVPNFGKMGADSFMSGIEMVRDGMQNHPDKLKELDNFMATNPYAQPGELQRVINTVVPGSQAQVMQSMGDDISASAKMNGGGLVQGFKGGGLVSVPKGKINSYQDAIDAGIPVEDTVVGDMRFGEIMYKETGYRKGLKKANKVIRKRWNFSGNTDEVREHLAMSTRDYVNMRMGWGGASSAKVKSLKPKDSSKSGGSSGILGPISSNVDAMVNTDKYEVKPKEKKNVVIAYEQEAGKGKQQKTAPPPGGNDIPSFDVRPPFMTDQDKLMVLGMRV